MAYRAALRRHALSAVVPATVLAAWEVLGRLGVLSEDGFSRPGRFFPALARGLADGTLLEQTIQTYTAAALGLAIAVVLGVAAGAILGLLRPLERAASLTIDMLRPVPSVALVPLALLVFGFSRNMSASVAAFACFWPMLIVTIGAVRAVDPRLIEVGRMLGLSPIRRIVQLALPAATPGIMVGVRIAAGIAIVVTVTTEIVANPRGLGYGMTIAGQSLQADLVWATLAWLGLTGWLVNWLMLAGERRWLAWYWAVRA